MNLHGGLKKNTQLFDVEKALYFRRGALCAPPLVRIGLSLPCITLTRQHLFLLINP